MTAVARKEKNAIVTMTNVAATMSANAVATMTDAVAAVAVVATIAATDAIAKKNTNALTKTGSQF